MSTGRRLRPPGGTLNPALVLHELIDGDFVPVVAAAGGGTFAMREPFAFEIDPDDLLDEEG